MLWGVIGVGVCEMLVMTPGLSWTWAPNWLASAVTLVGFFAFLVLVGFTSLLGNLAVGTMLLAALWRGCGWPFWRAALAASPYWIVFYRLVPKPW